MQSTVNRNLFLENPNSVMRAISSRTTIPIPSGIKLNLTDGTLALTGSDTDISIEIQIPINDDLVVQSTGSIVLPACFFNEIVEKLPDKDFSFEVRKSFQTKIISENTEFMINGLDANNYSHLPEISTDALLKISGKTLRKIINETVSAVATQESRPTLAGVNFIFNNSSIKVVAANNHRLSQRQISLENGPQTSTDLIIPGESLVELARVTGGNDLKITVNPGGNQVLFEVGNIAFYFRLLDSQYPDTGRLVLTEPTTPVELKLPVLVRSLERANLLTCESRDNIVKMTLGVQNQLVKFQSDSPEIDNVEEKIGLRKLEGEDLTILFNPDYLGKALRASITDSITMNFT